MARATRRRPAVYTDYREMLARERPDAVSLALPPALNPEAAAAALAAGCHTLAEKPIADSLAAARPMLSLADRYGRTLMIAENYRYVAVYRRGAALIAAGVIGQPVTLRWSLYHLASAERSYYHTAWRQNPTHPGGYVSDGGVHQAAVMRDLLGEVDAVTAYVTQARPDLPPADTVSASLRFANGALGSYAITYAVPGPETPLQVAGTEGALLIWRDRWELWRRGRQVDDGAEPSPVDGLVAMYEDLARAIRTGQPPRSTAAEGYADLRVIVALLKAGETGQEIRVAEVG
jgi:predicted dehydrogenase